MPYKRLNITIPEDIYNKLLKIAKIEDRPLSNIIKRMIEQYKIKEEEKK